MRIFFLSIVSLIFVGAFLVYMFTYTVRFTEVAVVTTLGEASDDIVVEPGLKFKWPSPIQSTTVYDKRVRVVRTRSETMSTADARQLVVETFMTWRVSDPLAFYQRFRSKGSDSGAHYESAEGVLIAQLRGEMSSVIGRYRMSQLFSPQAGASLIPAMEADLTDAMRNIHADVQAGTEAAYGVEVVSVGVLKIVLPEEVTRTVQEVMKASRKRRAAEELSAGTAEASATRARAINGAERIRAAVELLAASLRSAGDIEAAQYLAQLNEDPELAVFLETMQFMRQGLGKNLTVIMPSSVMKWLAPESLEAFTRGEMVDLLPEARGAGAAEEKP